MGEIVTKIMSYCSFRESLLIVGEIRWKGSDIRTNVTCNWLVMNLRKVFVFKQWGCQDRGQDKNSL